MSSLSETAGEEDLDLERAIAFERWLCERTSSHAEAVPLGTLFTHDGFPARHDSNLLWTGELPAGVSAGDLHAEADRGLAAFPHREILVNDDEVGLRVRAGLEVLGYEADRLVVMSQRRAPDRVPERLADEVSIDEVRPLFEEVAKREHSRERSGVDPPQASAWAAHLARTIGARFFGVRVEDEIGGSCDLYQDGSVAMVEDVATLEEFRGRGIARACVLAAVRSAREAGADLVFLHALAGDWPRHLYAKLGFDGAGHVWSFTRRSAD